MEHEGLIPSGAPPSHLWAGLPGFKSDRSGGWEELQLAPRGYVPLARAGALQEGALKIAARDVRLPKTNFSG